MREYGNVSINLNPDPSGGHWSLRNPFYNRPLVKRNTAVQCDLATRHEAFAGVCQFLQQLH